MRVFSSHDCLSLPGSIDGVPELTVLPEWELWACAQHYVCKYGEDAGVIAAMRCDELLEAGDLAGVRTYRAILSRIDRLLAPASGALN
jgi:hypothetical protein